MSLEDEGLGGLRARAHPVRLRMLSLLTGAELSAAEVARELEITQANASYHLRLLERAGLVTLTGEREVRGGRAKLYRHVWDAELPQERRSARPAPDEDGFVDALAAAIPVRAAQRDRGPGNFTDAELWVEPQVWERIDALVMEASTLLHASAQPPRTPGTRRVSLSIAAFPMTSGPRR